jgi:hypothetical protein
LPRTSAYFPLIAAFFNLPAFFSGDPRYDRSPALLPVPAGALFLLLLPRFPAFFLFGDYGVRDDADTLRQSLLFALFFSPFNFDINIVRVAPFFLELATLLPEAALFEAFADSQMFGETGVHVAANLFDLDYGAPHRFFVAKRKFFHTAQECDDMIHALIQQE